MDLLDNPILAYRLVCNGTEPLTNRMVVARRGHECFICAGPIAKGERIRAESRRSEDGRRIVTWRVCAACCSAVDNYMRAARPGPNLGAETERAALDARHDMGEAAWKARA